MAMTLEQKVAKKAKGMNQLLYKKGVAVVLLSMDERGSEYDSDTRCKVQLHFKSKAAINRVGKLLGEIYFNKKEMLAQYEKGFKSKTVEIDLYQEGRIEGGQNIVKKLDFYYTNDYSGTRLNATLDPRVSLTKEQEDFYTGSVADGEPLSSYFQYLQGAIIKGDIRYIV